MGTGSSTLDLISVGDATIDAFLKLHNENEHCRLDKEKNELCLHYGEKILIDQSLFLPGGNANNVAVGASRLGIKTSLVSEFGDDEFSEIIIKNLKKENIDTSFITQTPNSQANFGIVITFQGDKVVFVRHLPREHQFLLDGISTKWVYLTSMGKEWQKPYENVLTFVKKSGAKLAFNPGSPQFENGLESFVDVVQRSDILFVNKSEAMEIVAKVVLAGPAARQPHAFPTVPLSGTGPPRPKDLLKELQNLGSKSVVITDGANGSYVIDENKKMYHISCSPGEVVQKAGAGDAYTSGFLSAIILGENVQNAMKWGAINATAVIQKVGAQTGLLMKEQIDERIKENQEFETVEI